MTAPPLLDALHADIARHCQARGFREGPGVNNFIPHSALHAFAMARQLVATGFDRYVAIAPEGHVYGYFFEAAGARVESVFVDYPPTRCETDLDRATLAGRSVLLIEDDVIGGRTLRLVLETLLPQQPRTVALFLGHSSGIQHLRNVPDGIARTYLADTDLVVDERLERQFEHFLVQRLGAHTG